MKIRQTEIPVPVTNDLNGFYPSLSLYVENFHSSSSILNWERLTLISFQRDVSVIYRCNIYFGENNIGSFTLLLSLVAVLVISDFTLLFHSVFPKSHSSLPFAHLVFAILQNLHCLLHPQSKHTQNPCFASCSVHEKQRTTRATPILMNLVRVFFSVFPLSLIKSSLCLRDSIPPQFLYVILGQKPAVFCSFLRILILVFKAISTKTYIIPFQSLLLSD